MRITNEFNKLYHGAFLNDLFIQMLSEHRLAMSFDKFKQELKRINDDYPCYNGTQDKVSTRDIRSKDLIQHIEFIRLYASEYGFTLSIDDEAYRRMMELAHALGHN